jgi:hypothetical protein
VGQLLSNKKNFSLKHHGEPLHEVTESKLKADYLSFLRTIDCLGKHGVALPKRGNGTMENTGEGENASGACKDATEGLISLDREQHSHASCALHEGGSKLSLLDILCILFAKPGTVQQDNDPPEQLVLHAVSIQGGILFNWKEQLSPIVSGHVDPTFQRWTKDGVFPTFRRRWSGSLMGKCCCTSWMELHTARRSPSLRM